MYFRIARLILYLVPAFFMASCGQVKEPDFKRIENVRISKMGLSESTLTLDLHYYNPNKFRLKIKEAEGDAWIENTLLGHFTIDTMVHIPANGEFRLPVKLQVDMGKILKNSLLAFLAKEVMIRLEGNARLGKGLVYINYPIRYEGKQDLEKLLK
ncbi:MAG: LEA type 2 family protein [Bacteroidota bacterium]|nr:LEA type 2 family protein [Bacteroidota bacterium]